MESLIQIRDYNPSSDEGFVYKHWMKGNYHDNDWFSLIHPQVYHKNYHKVLEYLIPRSKIRCACLVDDGDVNIGFSVIEGHKLHWIYVKPSWRRNGIAKKLLVPEIRTVTHLTRFAKIIKPHNWRFNPFLEDERTK